MKVVIQRVSRAQCVIDNQVTAQINNGYLLLVGFTNGDNRDVVQKMAYKVKNLRIFEDEHGKTNLSISDVNGEVLSISQFTLYANTSKGNRPSFIESMEPNRANELYEQFNDELRKLGLTVASGVFGAHMEIALVNDGPMTIILEF